MNARLYEHAEALGQDLPAATVAALDAEQAVFAAQRKRVNLKHFRDQWPLPAEVQAYIADQRAGGCRSADLDPTPVDDLEVDHDPCATADLDRALDDAFGPLPPTKHDIENARRAVR